MSDKASKKFIILFDDMSPYIAAAEDVYSLLKQFLKEQDALNQKMINILIDSNPHYYQMKLPELVRIINTSCCLYATIKAIYAISEQIYRSEELNIIEQRKIIQEAILGMDCPFTRGELVKKVVMEHNDITSGFVVDVVDELIDDGVVEFYEDAVYGWMCRVLRDNEAVLEE